MLDYFHNNYTVIDLETTGLSPEYNEIIELSAIKVADNKIVGEYNQLVKPKKQIDYFISNLTGIDDETVMSSPSIEEVIDDYCKFIGKDVVVGHNVVFDIGFVRALRKTFVNESVDTMFVSRKLLPDLTNHKLHTLASHFNCNTSGMHRGLKDCQVTNTCYCEMRKIAETIYGKKTDVIQISLL